MNPRLRAVVKDLLPPLATRALIRARDTVWPSQPAPIIGRERDAAYYDRSFLAHDLWLRHYSESHHFPMWSVVVDRIRRTGVRSILDIGCGPGQMATLVRDSGFERYHGIDFSGERIKRARAICPEFEFTHADVLESDLIERLDYDAVVSTEFLEHVERDLEVLDRIKPGTPCFCTVPSFTSLGHVRFFRDRGEVSARYADRFDGFEVVEHLADPQGTKFFIMEGVKR